MSAPKAERRAPRKRLGPPLPLSDADLDRLSNVGPDDADDARAWWKRGQRRRPIAALLDARTDDNG